MREYLITYEIGNRSAVEHFLVLSADALCHEIDAIIERGGRRLQVTIWN